MKDSKNKGVEVTSESLEKVDGGTIYHYTYTRENRIPDYVVNGKHFLSLEDAESEAENIGVSTEVEEKTVETSQQI